MGQICQSCKYRSYAANLLSEDQLCILNENCSQVNFKKGDTIFKQDSFSLNICYLKTGLVKLHMKGLSGKDHIIKIAKSPSYLGIPTTIGDEICHYSATAIEDSSVCFIDNQVFKELILGNQQFAYEIILDMCRNELLQYRNCLNKTQKNTRGLVADTLLNFTNNVFQNNKFVLPISRNEIANLINSSRESVCRILSEFHNDNILQIAGKEVTILDMERLTKISEKG